MGMDASWPLKAAILDVLRCSDRLQAAMGDDCHLTESISASASHPGLPSVTMDRVTSQVWHSATFDGQDHEVVLQVRADDGLVLQDISLAVTETLHNADFPVAGHALIEMSFESSQTRSGPDVGQDRCLMFFRALTVSD